MEAVDAILVAVRAIDRMLITLGWRRAEEVNKDKGGLRKILLNGLDIIDEKSGRHSIRQ